MPQAAIVGLVAVAVFIELRRVVEIRVRSQGQGEDARVVREADRAAVQAGGPDVAIDLGTGKAALGCGRAATGFAIDQLFEHQVAAVFEYAGVH